MSNAESLSVTIDTNIPLFDLPAKNPIIEDYITDDYLEKIEINNQAIRENQYNFPFSFLIKPTENPDTTTLSFGEAGLRVIEPKGKIVRGGDAPRNREFILRNGHDTSVAFKTTTDLDIVAFCTPEQERTNYVARNGHYVELGTIDLSGGMIAAQYPLSGGERLSLSADTQVFQEFNVSDSIDQNSVKLIKDVCSVLRDNKHTPSPLLLDSLVGMVSTVVQTGIRDNGSQTQLAPINQPLLL